MRIVDRVEDYFSIKYYLYAGQETSDERKRRGRRLNLEKNLPPLTIGTMLGLEWRKEEEEVPAAGIPSPPNPEERRKSTPSTGM